MATVPEWYAAAPAPFGAAGVQRVQRVQRVQLAAAPNYGCLLGKSALVRRPLVW